MPRLSGIEPENASLFTRLTYWMVKRQIGRVIEPLKAAAHQPRLLWGGGQMEMAQHGMHSVPGTLKELASIKTAMLIGCPF